MTRRPDRDTLVARPPSLLPRVLTVVVMGALVFAALSAWADARALGAQLAAYRWEAFALALLLTLGNYALRFVRWHHYLGALEVRVPPLESALVFLSGFAVSITPGKLGEVYKSFLLYERRGTAVTRTAPIVVAERLTDLVALVVWTAVGALAFRGGWVIAAGGALAVGVLLVASAWRPLGLGLLRLAAALPWLGRLVPRLREAYDALWSLTRPRPLALATALAVVAWGFEVAALHAVLAGFEPSATLGVTATSFAYAAPTIAGALALLPGGLGVTEAGMTALLLRLGDGTIGTAVATAATILVRLATLWFAVVLGAAAWAALRFVPPVRGAPVGPGARGTRAEGGAAPAPSPRDAAPPDHR